VSAAKFIVRTANVALVGVQVGEGVYAYHPNAPSFVGAEAPSSPHTDPETPQFPAYLGAGPVLQTSTESLSASALSTGSARAFLSALKR
jgi:hypothetical protein